MKLDDITRHSIISYKYNDNLSNCKIAKKLCISKTTVANTLSRYSKTGSTDDIHRSGRKKKIASTSERLLCNQFLNGNLKSVKEAIKWYEQIGNGTISTWGVRNILRKNNIVFREKEWKPLNHDTKKKKIRLDK